MDRIINIDETELPLTESNQSFTDETLDMDSPKDCVM